MSISDIPAREYHAIKACSSSQLHAFGRSPAYCRYLMDHPMRANAPMILGSLVHALVLEPGAVEGRFAIKDYDARTAAGKERRDELAAAGIEVLSPADWARAHVIADRVLDSWWWGALENVRTEVSIVWEDGDHATLCRARPDILATIGSARILADLKVCRLATQDTYLRNCVSLYHPQQLAMYARGLDAIGDPVSARWVLAVHPAPPHELCAYLMSDALNDWADRAIDRRLLEYEECVRFDEWPDGSAGVVEVPLPEWALDDDVMTED